MSGYAPSVLTVTFIQPISAVIFSIKQVYPLQGVGERVHCAGRKGYNDQQVLSYRGIVAHYRVKVNPAVGRIGFAFILSFRRASFLVDSRMPPQIPSTRFSIAYCRQSACNGQCWQIAIAFCWSGYWSENHSSGSAWAHNCEPSSQR